MQRNTAETIAIQALGWLAANEELLPVFLGATGVGTDEMGARVQEPEFLGSVLEFLMNEDAWVMQFCDEIGLGYDQPMAARQSLPGGEQINWT